MKHEEIVANIKETLKSTQFNIKHIKHNIIHLENDWDYFTSVMTKNELSQYLYSVCHQLNCFSIPTPYVADESSYEYFSRTLRLLEKIEGNWYDNVSALQIDEIIWNFHNKIAIPNNISMNEINLNDYVHKLKNIKKPIGEGKIKEFEEHKTKLKQLLSGFKESTLKTVITTSIPASPVSEKIIIKTNYYGFETVIKLSPEFMDSGQSLLSTFENNYAIPTANSQWQHCICKVEISINGLLDPRFPAENLSLPPDGTPNNNSPFIHYYLFTLLEKISWEVYDPENKFGKWLIAPNDIGTISYTTFASGNSIDHMIKDSPGQSIIIRTKNNNETIITDICLDSEKPWFEKCLVLSKEKLGAGNTNEAVFWLNVGVEALFEKRVEDICLQSGIDYLDVSSSKSYWMNAKEIVEKYIPKEVHKIKWPENTFGPVSWYSKIKYLNKKVELKKRHNEILEHYSKINKHRNAIFHGTTNSRVDSKSVLESINSYNWIIENFKLKNSP